MPIYDRPVWKLMQDEAAPELVEPFTRADVTHWFGDHYPKVKPSTVGAHVIALTANHPSRHHYRVPAGAPPLFFRRPDGLLEHFDPDKHIEIVAVPGDGESSEVAEVTEQAAEFALESQLESFLVSNWDAIDWGRSLQIWTGSDGEIGHQLPLPVGRLDFLCVDTDIPSQICRDL